MAPDWQALAPSAAPPGDDPVRAVHAITRSARSSFALGLRLVQPPGRAAMHALYAFARVVDDIADGPFPAARKRTLLEAWRAEIEAAYAGCPATAIGAVLRVPVRTMAVPRAEFDALIDGMEIDAGPPLVAPSMAKLRLYCRRVAGSVGLISMRFFGAWRGDVSERFALALGDALQLTNILRDLEEDARRGRLYLPAELLEAEDIPPVPHAALSHPRLPRLCRRLAMLASVEFDAARLLVAEHERRAIAPALAMMGSYESVLTQLAQADFRPGTPIGRARRVAGSLSRLAFPGSPGPSA